MLTVLLPTFLFALPGSTPASLAAESPSRTWFVNVGATGAKDGISWRDAFIDLQDALAVAKSGDEIWIARGTYKPDRGTKDRAARFSAPAGVKLRGGFGGNETSAEERLPGANETLLSGDLNGDDGPLDCEKYTDCCVEHDGRTCDDAECLAAVCEVEPHYCCDADFPVDRWLSPCAEVAKRVCCFVGSGHRCENSYGVLHVRGGEEETILDRITVAGAYVDEWALYHLPYGVAGAWIDGARTKVSDCKIRDHVSSGLVSIDAARVEVDRSWFLDNTWSGLALGPPLVGESELIVTNSRFERNTVGVNASAVPGRSPVAISRCTFLDNRSNGVSVSWGAVIDGCWFEGNGGRGVHYVNGLTTVTNSVFLNNGGGLFGVAPLIASNCIFLGCEVNAIYSGGSANIKNCIFAGNPRIGLYASAPFSMRNCAFFDTAGAIFMNADDPATGRINNSIFWGNKITHPTQTTEDASIQLFYHASLEINHSIVEGWTGQYGGVGNSGLDPMFVDPNGPDGAPGTLDDDLRLLPGSPAINAGDPTGAFLPLTDFDGYPRVLCGRVDLGPYESGMGDYDCNGAVDLLDIAALPTCLSGPAGTGVAPGCESFDYDANGAVDLLDLAHMQSAW